MLIRRSTLALAAALSAVVALGCDPAAVEVTESDVIVQAELAIGGALELDVRSGGRVQIDSIVVASPSAQLVQADGAYSVPLLDTPTLLQVTDVSRADHIRSETPWVLDDEDLKTGKLRLSFDPVNADDLAGTLDARLTAALAEADGSTLVIYGFYVVAPEAEGTREAMALGGDPDGAPMISTAVRGSGDPDGAPMAPEKSSGDPDGAPMAGDPDGAPMAGDPDGAPMAGDPDGAPMAGDPDGAPMRTSGDPDGAPMKGAKSSGDPDGAPMKTALSLKKLPFTILIRDPFVHEVELSTLDVHPDAAEVGFRLELNVNTLFDAGRLAALQKRMDAPQKAETAHFTYDNVDVELCLKPLQLNVKPNVQRIRAVSEAR